VHRIEIVRVARQTLALLGAMVFAAAMTSGQTKPDGKTNSETKTNSEISKDSGPAAAKQKPQGKASSESKAEAAAAAPDDTYRIGVEDELQISVWREPELSVSVVVRPDGKITMPLLNDVAVVGMRPDELQASLTEKLKSVVNEPQVTVIVRQIHSRKVYLFGEVTRPGTYALNGRKSVLELIAEGGGFTPFAKRDSIYILRKGPDGKQTRFSFNYKKALNGKSENFFLEPGDVVVVR